MPKYATRDEVKELLSVTADAAVTIYMPTHRVSSPPHVQEDTTRYKNQVRRAEELLHEKNAAHETTELIIKQLETLMDKQEFWTHQADGLAVLATKDSCKVYNLPLTIDEYVAVDERFHLTPLMIQFEENQKYVVLALAVHEPILFVGDSSSFEPSDIELPISPETAMNIDEMHVNRLKQRGARVRQPNTGSAPAIFHGHGGAPRDVEPAQRQHFFKMIDDIICDKTDTSLPLLVLGTDNMVTEYKSFTKHPNFIDPTVDGNRTRDDQADLHRLTWQVVQENVIGAKRAQLLSSFEELVAQNRSLTDTTEIQSVATEGRIDTLLVGMTIITTDTVTDQVESVPKVVFPENYAVLDATAKDVFDQSGRVVGLPREQMPEQAPMAAILRY